MTIPHEIPDLLEDLAGVGVELAVGPGGGLLYRPAAAVTPDLARRVRTHKLGLLAVLRGIAPEHSAAFRVAELMVLVRAGLAPADVPAVGVVKTAFADMGGLTVVGFEPLDIAAEVAALSEDWREAWEERAGIMEFDANLPRERAERLALADIRAWMSDVNGTRRNKPADGGGGEGRG